MPLKKEIVYIGKTARIMLIEDNPIINPILREFLKIADRKNILHLNTFRSQTILKKIKIKNPDSSYLRKELLKYLKNNYICKIGKSTYIINPLIAFNCSNPEFIQLREDYERYREIAFANNKKRSDRKSVLQQAKNILKNFDN